MCAGARPKVERNAVALERIRSFAGRARAAGIALVDGGLIGPPARSPGSTRLYLSGSEAESAAALFAASPLEALPIGGEIGGEVGAASALKMAYAAYTKGLAALLLGAHSCAREHGVESALLAEWERSQPGLVQRLEAAAAHVAPRAWRFAGEMDEIARSFAAVGLPAGFHEAAADLYRRMAEFKDAEQSPTVDEVAAALESGAPPWRR
jgi:3-hydroxyisobutyrate dehydrogenase-like beta-hydroxyacid dehydrogenase